ncbi:glycosyltransferase family 4 protein [Campylobacter sp. MIT 21-1685]|uniref:glycosyltransferase family 4 protein n=1 Tax=unclassified Campylobacter TaxID=2593542 RepID=UPI00224A6ADB|nr:MULTISPECIES: glycosyltransferase family 4 protein [unclassified Campylobacter]MCX2683208.1 glycosyltransferase family 4 protein [Campylobacter sp. MIT 21-1684]MCX2751472.1 glycosyltransferase family 4 protein [Campylobacter sp. MIT 21-1682]MCX2807689.1 glycosyltransferase family 4 protein [Campylobacter sp. MIT 21-1685]
MKIGFLSHSGASIYHFRMPIIKALQARGDEVFVLVPQDEYTQKLQNLGLNVVCYTLKRKSINPFIVFSNFLHLKKILKDLHLDLLQSAAHKSNTFGIFAAKCVKIPYKLALVEGLGSFYIENTLKAKLIRTCINFLYKRTFTFVEKMIFVNYSNAEFMRKLGLKEEKICIIRTVGINIKKFFPVQISKETKKAFWSEFMLDEKPVVLMVSRALWHKGIKEFYEAAELLKTKANFVLVGGVDENPSCANLEFLHSGKVKYLGEREDIATLLWHCDIFTLPSYKEGFPLSVLEAKACGKAIIVSDCEGCVEAITNAFDGLWVKTGESKDLAEKICLLLDDESLRFRLGKNAAKDALQYDETGIAKQYLALYDTLRKEVNV